MSPAQVGPTHFLEFIFAVEVPKKQAYVGIVMANDLLVDFDADSGEVGLRIEAFDEAANETGFADGEGPEHADFLLNHG